MRAGSPAKAGRTLAIEKQSHGDGRYILKVKHEGSECKFFTNATPIKNALDQINKTDLPFTTIIKQQRFGTGSGKTFYFT